MEDLEIECSDCGTHFIFYVGQQQRLKKLFQEGIIARIFPPKRCMKCRNALKAQQGESRPAVRSVTRHQFEGDEELIKELNNK